MKTLKKIVQWLSKYGAIIFVIILIPFLIINIENLRSLEFDILILRPLTLSLASTFVNGFIFYTLIRSQKLEAQILNTIRVSTVASMASIVPFFGTTLYKSAYLSSIGATLKAVASYFVKTLLLNVLSISIIFSAASNQYLLALGFISIWCLKVFAQRKSNSQSQQYLLLALFLTLHAIDILRIYYLQIYFASNLKFTEIAFLQFSSLVTSFGGIGSWLRELAAALMATTKGLDPNEIALIYLGNRLLGYISLCATLFLLTISTGKLK